MRPSLMTALGAVALANATPAYSTDDNPSGGRDAWMQCLVSRAGELARSDEAAEVVARAALSSCATFETGARQEVAAITASDLLARRVASNEAEARRLAVQAEADIWPEQRANMEGRLLAIIIEARFQ